MGASNDARETEAWLIAGTGDDKTDILIGADAYDRQAIYSADRNITSNAQAIPFGGADNRSNNKSGQINTDAGVFILDPNIAVPTPHFAPNAQTDPQYIPRPFDGHNGPFFNSDFFKYNFAALTPSIPAGDRQSFYGSVTRDICDKYLAVFADFKYTRSFFDAALAATPFAPDALKKSDGTEFSPTGISVPIQTAFNPFLGFLGRNTEAAIIRVYVTLHTDGAFELPLGYFHLDGDLFNLPAGPLSFAAGIEYHGERWRNNPDSENTSFDTIGSTDF